MTKYRTSRCLALGTMLYLACRIAGAAAAPPSDAPSGLSQTDLFVSGDGAYHAYRIPALIVSNKGTVLAFVEARRHSTSDIGDIDLLLRRSFDGGRTWQPAQEIWSEGSDTWGNPTPVVDRTTGTIWLLACHNRGDERDMTSLFGGTGKGSRTVWVLKSDDDGQSWSKPVEITQDVKQPDWAWYATGPGVGIQLRSGRLMIPCDFRPAHGEGATEAQVRASSHSHVIYSDDHGSTWKIGGILGPKFNECQVVELVDGRLMLNMRSFHGLNRRAVALSSDQGLTWRFRSHAEELIEPVCQASFLRYTTAVEQGRNRLLFSNPASLTRENMTIRLSYDEGDTWTVAKELHHGPAAYSCLAVLPDASIGCLYERSVSSAAYGPYERITFARLSLEWLTAGADSIR